MAEYEQQNNYLRHEIRSLKSDIVKQNSLCECLQNKLNNRDKEIQRLSSLLHGGRSINALNKDCCYKDMCSKLRKLTEDHGEVANEKKQLEMQLTEAIAKQHEAMKRALQLADRNRELERELRDIDQMALAVEEECNQTVKKNHCKVSKAQEQIENSHFRIQSLEHEIKELRRSKEKAESQLLIFKEEKDNMNRILENTLDDKKRMTDRINQFTRIEHDLNLEIDRLMQTCTLQKRKIADLEYQLTGKSENNSNEDMSSDKRRRTLVTSSSKCPNCTVCYRQKKNGKSNFVATQDEDKNDDVLERLKGERDYYVTECQRLAEELNNLPLDTGASSDVKRRLTEKEDTVKRLEREVQELTREKHDLISELESMKELSKWGQDSDCSSLKCALTRVEKERDLARGDVKRLEEERDSLRKRLKATTETHVTERDRLQKLMTDSEDKLRKLESERREMMTAQGSRRATINNLEDQMDSMSTQLRSTQSELEHIHTLYSQIKTLQEQTDRALADTQGQLTQIELEYAHSQDRVRVLEKERSELDKELSMLKNDVCVLKGNLTKVDCQRDNLLIELDNKTERIAALEQELKAKDHKLMSLETTGTELRQQLNLFSDDVASKDYQLKSSCTEIECIKRQLEEALKAKNQAISENRRLQNDLSKITLDWRNSNGDLERAGREIEDLKSQLQQYVFEVKRVEDLMTKKENERAEMLDQFRCLSQEANLLETSNHCLESKALEVKGKLCEAQNQIQDMECKCEQLNTLNKDYELQIQQLTCQIACLETQLKQHTSSNTKIEKELSSMKELCSKMDGQKDKLLKEIKEKDECKCTLEREKDRLKTDVNKLRESLDAEQANIGSLENLLAESRQETVEQRLINEELQTEIQRLKNRVEELQEKLSSVPSIHTFNTVDVRLHSEISPRSISSIFTNIMQKNPPETEIHPNTATTSYEINKNYKKKPSLKFSGTPEESKDIDTYRSHTTVEVECPKYGQPKTKIQTGSDKEMSSELTKATYCYGYKQRESHISDRNSYTSRVPLKNSTEKATILRGRTNTVPSKSYCYTRFAPDTR